MPAMYKKDRAASSTWGRIARKIRSRSDIQNSGDSCDEKGPSRTPGLRRRPTLKSHTSAPEALESQEAGEQGSFVRSSFTASSTRSGTDAESFTDDCRPVQFSLAKPRISPMEYARMYLIEKARSMKEHRDCNLPAPTKLWYWTPYWEKFLIIPALPANIHRYGPLQTVHASSAVSINDTSRGKMTMDSNSVANSAQSLQDRCCPRLSLNLDKISSLFPPDMSFDRSEVTDTSALEIKQSSEHPSTQAIQAGVSVDLEDLSRKFPDIICATDGLGVLKKSRSTESCPVFKSVTEPPDEGSASPLRQGDAGAQVLQEHLLSIIPLSVSAKDPADTSGHISHTADSPILNETSSIYSSASVRTVIKTGRPLPDALDLAVCTPSRQSTASQPRRGANATSNLADSPVLSCTRYSRTSNVDLGHPLQTVLRSSQKHERLLTPQHNLDVAAHITEETCSNDHHLTKIDRDRQRRSMTMAASMDFDDARSFRTTNSKHVAPLRLGLLTPEFKTNLADTASIVWKHFKEDIEGQWRSSMDESDDERESLYLDGEKADEAVEKVYDPRTPSAGRRRRSLSADTLFRGRFNISTPNKPSGFTPRHQRQISCDPSKAQHSPTISNFGRTVQQSPTLPQGGTFQKLTSSSLTMKSTIGSRKRGLHNEFRNSGLSIDLKDRSSFSDSTSDKVDQVVEDLYDFTDDDDLKPILDASRESTSLIDVQRFDRYLHDSLDQNMQTPRPGHRPSKSAESRILRNKATGSRRSTSDKLASESSVEKFKSLDSVPVRESDNDAEYETDTLSEDNIIDPVESLVSAKVRTNYQRKVFERNDIQRSVFTLEKNKGNSQTILPKRASQDSKATKGSRDSYVKPSESSTDVSPTEKAERPKHQPIEIRNQTKNEMVWSPLSGTYVYRYPKTPKKSKEPKSPFATLFKRHNKLKQDLKRSGDVRAETPSSLRDEDLQKTPKDGTMNRRRVSSITDKVVKVEHVDADAVDTTLPPSSPAPTTPLPPIPSNQRQFKPIMNKANTTRYASHQTSDLSFRSRKSRNFSHPTRPSTSLDHHESSDIQPAYLDKKPSGLKIEPRKLRKVQSRDSVGIKSPWSFRSSSRQASASLVEADEDEKKPLKRH